MKRFLTLISLLLASTALAIDTPITNGVLQTNLNANGFQVTNLNVTNLPLQPLNNNLTVISNGTGVSTAAVNFLAQPDVPSMVAFLGLTNTGTFVQNTPLIASKFFTAFNSGTGAFTQSFVNWSDIQGAPTLANNTPPVSNQVITGYNSSTGVFTQAQQSFSNLSGSATAGQLPALNNITIPNGDLSLNNHKITGLATPVNAADGARKDYVDTSVSAGIPPPHQAVAAATTANITLSGEQTIDGVTTSASRVLVKNETTASTNGLYVSAAGAWTRATDSTTSGQFPGGIFVSAGTVNANTGWAISNAQPINVGVDSLTYVQISSVPPSHNPVTFSGQNYLTLDQPNQILTANAVDLSGTNATGILAAARFPALSGQVTTVAGSLTSSIAANTVSNANLAQVPGNSIKGNKTSSTANATDLTVTDTRTLLSISNVENTALSTWPGSANITTLGSVTTGTWNGTTVSIAKGGTGGTTAGTALGNLLPAGSAGQSLVYLTSSTQAFKSTYRKVNVVVLTTTGTYTPSTGTTEIFVQAVGGGGGSAGAKAASVQTSVGSGGGGAGYAAKWITGVSGTYAYVIGAGGLAGIANNGPGGNGGNTTFTAVLSAGGGGGGTNNGSGTNLAQNGFGGTAGIGITGDIKIGGSDGTPSLRLSSSQGVTGNGGSSQLGGGGVTTTAGGSTDSNGNNGYNYGGGAGGAASFDATGQVGGTGAPGVIIITEYIATTAP